MSNTLKVCLIEEKKQPHDFRVALTPQQCAILSGKYPNITIGFEPSEHRCFSNEEYLNNGIKIMKPQDANILLGIKEVPIQDIIPNKTYLFFSHTIKKQDYNQKLLQTLAHSQCSLIDYECLMNPAGRRLLGFGRWAGLVGAYNSLKTYGLKSKKYKLKSAIDCQGLAEIKEELNKVSLPPLKIVVTGDGRVGKGVWELLEWLNLKEVNEIEFLTKKFDEAVFLKLYDEKLYQHKELKTWQRDDFFKNHLNYECTFKYYLHETDILINGMYWEETMDVLFLKEDIKPESKLMVIGDITCDVEGSVPLTYKVTYPNNPVFGIDKTNLKITAPYLPNTLDIMAVTNLPTELPRDASEDFGHSISTKVIPALLGDEDKIIENAQILNTGKLTEKFIYLEDYLNDNH